MQVVQQIQNKNYDSEFCGSIPLHLVNLIQPHGALFIADKSLMNIVQVSENIESLLGIPADGILNKPFASIIEAGQFNEIKSKIETWEIKDRIPFTIQFIIEENKIPCNATLHVKPYFIMIEVEPLTQHQAPNSFIEVYQEVKYIMAALKEAENTIEIGNIAAVEIKKLSGFDRIMIYQFDKDWNGTVLAEAKEPDMEPYLHLRFPASDVPKQARDLYFRNPYRLIPDRSFTPARLIPVLNPITKAFIDLSDCSLRSVPPVHTEYLKNMEVKASMSTPIIIGNQLWGLISCHHKTPKYPGYEMRAAFELISNIISVQLAAKENEKRLVNQSQLNLVHSRLLEQMYAAKSLSGGLLNKSPNVMELIGANGVALLYEGNLTTAGITPQPEQIKEIIKWLQIKKTEKVFATDSLSRMFVGSEEYAGSGSGLLAIPVSYRKGEYILGFRPEVIQTVDWGGNPHERIQFESDGKTYHPRNSFSIWRETVKNSSIPWSMQQIEAAETLRTAILEWIIVNQTNQV